MATRDVTFERGLPSNADAEQLVLGAVMLDDSSFVIIGAILEADDFSLEKHKRIFNAMVALNEAGERIDRITVANELMRRGQLESVDGIAYLVSLDNGLPQIYNLESYARIVKEKSTLRRLILSSQTIIERAMLDQEDPSVILGDAEESLLKLSDGRAKDKILRPGDIIEQFEGGISAFLDPSKRVSGLATGYFKLDEMTSGFHPGELIILAARPAMGKTALALNIAQRVATRDPDPRPVAVFSLEMSSEQLLTRLICAEAHVDQQKFRLGYLNHDERRMLQSAAVKLAEAPLFIDDTAGANIMDIHAKLRRIKAEHGLSLVVVDYLQLMSGRGRQENRTQEVSGISRGLKLLAKELKVPFLVLSQLSRATETRPQGDHIPQLSDLRESGSIEQDADMVWFIFRPEYYKPDRGDLKGLAEVIIAKQRNGPTGKAKLAFLRQFTKFENMTDDLPDPGAI
ncbi:MAG: replicative DNA helicase [Acidobacteria bacterium]|nr:replicative DNA helicase [Acidobacteriota bacterium]